MLTNEEREGSWRSRLGRCDDRQIEEASRINEERLGEDRRKSPRYHYISEAKSEESSRCAWTQSELKGSLDNLVRLAK